MSYPNSGPLAVNGCSLSSVGSTERRAAPAACLAFLGAGDMLMMTKPDRLARSTAELLTIEADLPRWGVGLVVLSGSGERLAPAILPPNSS